MRKKFEIKVIICSSRV